MAHQLALTTRIRGEFTEMPGLKLTMAQACRLWHTDEGAVSQALDALVAEGFVTRTASGAFMALPRPRARGLKAAMTDTHAGATRIA
jgi:DNA-binding GntR family transcriptional regulator